MTNFHYLTYLTMDLSLKHCSIVDYNKLKKEKKKEIHYEQTSLKVTQEKLKYRCGRESFSPWKDRKHQTIKTVSYILKSSPCGLSRLENNSPESEFVMGRGVIMAAWLTSECSCVTSDQWCYSSLPDSPFTSY